MPGNDLGNGSAASVDGGTLVGGDEQIGNRDSIDPADLGGTGSGSETGSDGNDGQPRQRKPRSDAGKTRGPRKSAPLDITDLKDLVLMAHVGLALAFRNPDIELADSEGEKLSNAIARVLRHYDIPDIASETKDWIGLIMCCGAIYGPRISAAIMDKKKSPASRNPEDETNVVTLQGMPQG